MKAKHFLIIAILSLIRMAEAQPANDPSLHRVQSSEKAAMTYLTEVVEPKYPRDVRISGKVVLKIVIDKEGHVSEATLVSGHPMLAGATIDAVKQWKFHPYNIFDEHEKIGGRSENQAEVDVMDVVDGLDECPRPRSSSSSKP